MTARHTFAPAMTPRDWAALIRAGFRIERAPPLTPAQIHAAQYRDRVREFRARQRANLNR